MDTTKKTARLAGLLYLIVVILAPISIIYIPSKTIVRGDTVATANKILANEFLFRTGIVTHLLCVIIFLFLALVLYRLFKQVNENQAKLMLALVTVQIPVQFVIEICKITSLMIFKGELLKTFELQQSQEIAMLFLRFNGYGILVLEILFGLWLIPFGLLVIKSGFIPKIFGILLIITGIAYCFEFFISLLFPEYRAFLSQFIFVFYFGEPAIMLWLLIKGVKEYKE